MAEGEEDPEGEAEEVEGTPKGKVKTTNGVRGSAPIVKCTLTIWCSIYTFSTGQKLCLCVPGMRVMLRWQL